MGVDVEALLARFIEMSRIERSESPNVMKHTLTHIPETADTTGRVRKCEEPRVPEIFVWEIFAPPHLEHTPQLHSSPWTAAEPWAS
jgi:hypothetical protein